MRKEGKHVRTRFFVPNRGGPIHYRIPLACRMSTLYHWPEARVMGRVFFSGSKRVSRKLTHRISAAGETIASASWKGRRINHVPGGSRQEPSRAGKQPGSQMAETAYDATNVHRKTVPAVFKQHWMSLFKKEATSIATPPEYATGLNYEPMPTHIRNQSNTPSPKATRST